MCYNLLSESGNLWSGKTEDFGTAEIAWAYVGDVVGEGVGAGDPEDGEGV